MYIGSKQHGSHDNIFYVLTLNQEYNKMLQVTTLKYEIIIAVTSYRCGLV